MPIPVARHRGILLAMGHHDSQSIGSNKSHCILNWGPHHQQTVMYHYRLIFPCNNFKSHFLLLLLTISASYFIAAGISIRKLIKPLKVHL